MTPSERSADWGLPAGTNIPQRKPLPFLRRITAGMHMLPDFIIIGGQRCGTTSLYRQLTTHPCIARSRVKEIHYFDVFFNKGASWYRSYFPSLLYKYYQQFWQNRNLLTGEASPYYMYYPHAPRRIAALIPRVKLIVMLRNPIDRAYSHYHHECKLGYETLSFEDAIEHEEERLAGEVEKLLADENYYSYSHRQFSYLARGIYVDQLDSWTRYFPRDQLMIMQSEVYYADPEKSYYKVLDFLGCPGQALQASKIFNKGNYPEMNAATRNSLRQYYAGHNRRLYDFLGVDFNWE